MIEKLYQEAEEYGGSQLDMNSHDYNARDVVEQQAEDDGESDRIRAI